MFVRSLGFHPSLPLTTGTFNLVVKEPNRLPPKRRAFSPARRHKCTSVCPRNLSKLRVGRWHCQPFVATGFPRLFHIGKTCWHRIEAAELTSLFATLRLLPLLSFPKRERF